jgi:hypothetical protein
VRCSEGSDLLQLAIAHLHQLGFVQGLIWILRILGVSLYGKEVEVEM